MQIKVVFIRGSESERTPVLTVSGPGNAVLAAHRIVSRASQGA